MKRFPSAALLLVLAGASAGCGSCPCATASYTGTTLPSNDDRREPVKVLHGRVSYYADSLAGHRTANGERYDPRAFTAASRDLPFGTRVRVIREDTGASVVVRVNDRGPFGDRRRILDLSRAAAEQIDMVRAGVVRVRAEVLARAD